MAKNNGNLKRYAGRIRFMNNLSEYRDIFIRKKLNFIKQLSTPVISRISNPQKRTLNEVRHVWKTGDRYYKLANQYYGRPEMWWVIALYNNAPTEGHLKRGQIVKVPTPIETVLKYL